MKIKIIAALSLIGLLAMPVMAKNSSALGQQKKAEVGIVNGVTGNTVTVQPKGQGKKRDITVGGETKFVGQDKKNLKVSQIKAKDLVAIVSTDSGTATEGGRKKPIKVFVKDASSSAQLKRRAVQGLVTNVSGNVITLVHQIQRDRSYTVFTSADTMIKSKEGSTATGSAQIQPGMRIVAVGDLVEGGILARRIHIIPGKATGIFKKQPFATGSGEPGTGSGTTPPPPPSSTDSGTPPPSTSSGTP